MSSESISNWDGTRQWTPEAIHHPENEDQIVALIQRTLEDQKRIKAVGTALSWSDISDMPQLAIRFDRMDKVLTVDRVNFPMEVRFVAADDIPLSPASGRDSCYIGAYVGSLKWATPYFSDFEALMQDYEGRPHWGKTFSRDHAALRKLYPAYDDFNRLRRTCDPHGLFRNSFVDRVFPAD